MPQPFRFQSSQKGEEKSSIKKLDLVNVSSSFVSVNTEISTWFEIRRFDWSNFLDMELMFRFLVMTICGFFSLTFFKFPYFINIIWCT